MKPLNEQFKQKFIDKAPDTGYTLGALDAKRWIKENILKELLEQTKYIATEYVPTQFDGTSNMDHVKITLLLKRIEEEF